MTGLRRHIALHRSWAAWLVALALALRIVVPTGYMPDVRGGQITVRLCDGSGSGSMLLALPGMDHYNGDHSPDSRAQPCAFADATIAGLDTIATLTLAVPILLPAIARRIARPRAPPRASPQRLRPPSQAPPLNG